MKVALIHNVEAGGGNDGPESLVAAIERGGHVVTVCTSKLEDALADAASLDLIAISGGDGTLGHACRAMIGRNVPIAVLPSGTANNIATSLGLVDLDPDALIAGWQEGRIEPFDVVDAKGPFGTRHLLEGFGTGLFAWTMRTAEDSPMLTDGPVEARLPHALSMMIERLPAHTTTRVDATLDGVDVSGDYLMFEFMNTSFIGPNLYLAPGASSADGMLELVTVTADERDVLCDHLIRWRRGALASDRIAARQGRRLDVRCVAPLHLDDEYWEPVADAVDDNATAMSVRPGALRFLVPARG